MIPEIVKNIGTVMIYDKDVKQLFKNGESILAKSISQNMILDTQFHRGVGLHTWKSQHPGGCIRHMQVFNEFNVIPKYCFNCYKVYIEPRTVVELFKLMVVFERLKLSNDNTRKCIVETREEVSGSYKGFIYCRGLEEGKEILKKVQKVVSKEISKRIPVTLKKGCSEYGLAYPEYAQIEKGKAMEYRKEWQEYENRIDQDLLINTRPTATDTHNHPGYTEQDAQIMLAWLKYAAMIGDESYLKISGRTLQPFRNMKRPTPFYLPGSSKKNQ